MQTRAHICIIDDDAIAVFGLKRALKAVGLATDPLIFENGLDAIDEFRRCIEEGTTLPELIFLDLNMPVMDGWDFMIEFRKLPVSEHYTPDIYVMTSSIDAKDIEIARKYGLESNYLVKPVSADVLSQIAPLI